MSEPVYPFVAIDVARDRAEELGALLFELGAGGVEERDEGTLKKGAGEGKVTLVGSFSTREEAEEAIATLVEMDPEMSPRIEEVVGDAWRDAWKEHFKPFALTPQITVRPPWEPYEKTRPDEMVLELEPGRAFGTGLHATTSLVAEALHARKDVLAGKEVLDVGTGSGILALAALLYGASRAIAIDVDPDVIEVVVENAERNMLADRVEARQGTVDTVQGTYPVVVANIETRVLLPIAEELVRPVAPGGLLVLSGILGREHDEILARYTSLGRSLKHLGTERRADTSGDDWVALSFEVA
jgi:ribosomal protein L11 methyltransferase